MIETKPDWQQRASEVLSRHFPRMPGKEFASEAWKRIQDYDQFMASSGIFDRIRRSYRAYFGMDPEGDSNPAAEIIQGGAQGELQFIKVNHLRNLGQHLLNLTTSNKPAMQAVATNTDYRSISQTILAQGVLEFFLREKRVERFLHDAAERAIAAGEGFIAYGWDATLGQPYMRDQSGRILKDGDMVFKSYDSNDVIRDPYKKSSREHDWLIVRDYVNKYELAAKNEELAEEIEGLSGDPEERLSLTFQSTDSDDVPVYTFYHRKTAAVPKGRMVRFLSADIILEDNALPYRDIPVLRICPGEFIGTSYGYSPMFDLLALQQVVDGLFSAVLSNQNAGATPILVVPKGSDFTKHELDGFNVVEADMAAGKPEVLNLTKTPKEVFDFMEIVVRTMETISGINSTVRGNPEKNIVSGSMAALVHAQAVTFAAGLQASYNQLYEDVATAIIHVQRDYVRTKKQIRIAGREKQYITSTYTGDDLAEIDRITVESTNPLWKNAAGKMQIADNLLNAQQIDAYGYVAFLEHGNLETLLEGKRTSYLNIKSENEELAAGKPVIAVPTDDHAIHIREHAAVIANPMARLQEPIRRAVMAHIQEHIMALQTLNPGLLMVLGQTPIPPMMMPGMVPGMGAGGPPSGPGTPPSGPPGGPPPPQPGMEPGSLPGMPDMPVNPATGERWEPQGGGGMAPPV